MRPPSRDEQETAPKARRVGRPARDGSEFLDAAVGVFSAKGLAGSNMDDLAAAGGTTKPTLYARFGSKDGLYERVVQREAEAFIAHVLASYEDAKTLSFYDTIAKPMEAWFGYNQAHPAELTLLFSPDRSPAAQRVAEEVEDRIVDGLAQGVQRMLARSERSAPAQARFLGAMVFGATLHATRQNSRAQELSVSQAVALATSFVSHGYRGLDRELLKQPGEGLAAGGASHGGR